MDEFEKNGNGLSGRVDGPLSNARYILIPASLLTGVAGESVQTIAQGESTVDPASGTSDSFTVKVLETMATMPLDAKAIGIGCAVMAAAMTVHAARAERDIAIENSIIAAGLDRASAVEPAPRRALKRLATTAIGGTLAFLGYKTGTHLNMTEAFVADLGIISTGLGYAKYMQARITGKFRFF